MISFEQTLPRQRKKYAKETSLQKSGQDFVMPVCLSDFFPFLF